LNDFKVTLAKQYFAQAEPEEVRALMEALLRPLCDALPKKERLAFLKTLLRDYLPDLLEGFTSEDKLKLAQALLPALARELPFDISTSPSIESLS
jgi:hypothetical protein